MWPGTTQNRTFNAEKPPKKAVFQKKVVGVQGLEPWASCSQTIRKNFFRSFLMVFSCFGSLLLTLYTSLNLRFPGVPALSVVIYVVKNASRPVSGELSPVPDGKRFSLLCGLYCNSEEGVMQVVSAGVAAQKLRRYRQRIASRIYLLEIELTLRNSRHKIKLQSRCL